MTGRWPSSSRILVKSLPKPLGQLTESNGAREWTGLAQLDGGCAKVAGQIIGFGLHKGSRV